MRFFNTYIEDTFLKRNSFFVNYFYSEGMVLRRLVDESFDPLLMSNMLSYENV